MILPGATIAEAEAFAHRASAALRAAAAGVTFSWGVAGSSGPGWRPALLLRAADVAQYQAKRVGGDCVRLATAPVAGVPLRRGTPRMRDHARRRAAADRRRGRVAGRRGPRHAGDAPARGRGRAGLRGARRRLLVGLGGHGGRRRAPHRGPHRPPRRPGRPRGAPARRLRARRLPAHAPRAAGGRRVPRRRLAPGAEEAIGALLRSTGRSQVLAGAAGDRLVELFGDASTPPMDWAAAPLRLLVREATSSARSA